MSVQYSDDFYFAINARLAKTKLHHQISVLTMTDSKSSDGLLGSVQFRQEGGEREQREEVRKSSPQSRIKIKRLSVQANAPLATSGKNNTSVVVVDHHGNKSLNEAELRARIKSRDMF